jgi:MFS family permease
MTTVISNDEKMSGVYGRVFWLAYLANSILVMGNALTFRFAELIHFLGGTESVAGDVVAFGTAVAVVLRLSVSHVLDDYGTRRMWPICAVLYISGCLMFLTAAELNWVLYAARASFFVGLTGMFACSMTHIQNHVPPERRTEIIGNLGSSGFVGMILGSNISDLILLVPDKQTKFQLLFGGAAALGLFYLVIVMLLTRDQLHVRPHPTPPAFRLLLRFWPGGCHRRRDDHGVGRHSHSDLSDSLRNPSKHRGDWRVLYRIRHFSICVSPACAELGSYNWTALDAGSRSAGTRCRSSDARICHRMVAIRSRVDPVRLRSRPALSSRRLAGFRGFSEGMSGDGNRHHSWIH